LNKLGIWAIVVAGAFFLGILTANPVVEAVGGWKEAIEDLQAQIDTLTGGSIDADTLDGIDSSSFVQSPVTSSDIQDSTITFSDMQGIDGTPITGIWNSRIPKSNTLTSVDTTGNVGIFTSITIGTDGLPIVSYTGNDDLKVTHCGNASCSSGNTITTVDNTNFRVFFTSITIGTDGLPIVSYFDGRIGTVGELKVAHCGNVSCSSGNTITTVDNAGIVGETSSITIGTDGLPVISYNDFTNRGLKVAHCGNVSCSSGNTITTVDSVGGSSTSIMIGTDGLPVISYFASGLKVAHCGNASCSSGNTLTSVDTADGSKTSITIGTDGLPVISYSGNSNLKVAHCGNAFCSSGNTLTTVDNAGIVGDGTSITIGTDGLPIVSYRDTTNRDLKVAHCGNVSCSSGNTITTVDNIGEVGRTSSITIGTDGLPIVSYRDRTNQDLKVAHCGSILCISNWIRR